MQDHTSEGSARRTLAGPDEIGESQLSRATNSADLPARSTGEAERLKAELADLRLLDRQRQGAAVGLVSERDELRRELVRRDDEIKAIKGSTVWRVLGPLHALSARYPRVARQFVRAAKIVAWTLTLQLHRRLPQLLAERRAAHEAHALRAAQPQQDVPSLKDLPGPTLVESVLDQRFSALLPFPVYRVSGIQPRLTLVTDSINAGSLFGGVATAIILAAELAKASNRRLRVVTRTEVPHQDNLLHVLSNANVDYSESIEFALSAPGKQREIDIGDSDIFLTTSWWSTYACRKVIPSDRIIYLLQEDERDFYSAGDDRLRCAETFADERIRFVINSKLLSDHLAAQGYRHISRDGVWFEPAFPTSTYYSELPEGTKSNFFFYARPLNVRNLFYRGIEAIGEAVQQGVLKPNEWQFHFVGKDLDPQLAKLPFEPKLMQNLNWADYTALVRRMDLGLSLMYTPHPSYPPLDLAASGAVVVTNRYGIKQDLSGYSRNIICAEPDVPDLVRAIGAGVALAHDKEQRAANYRASALARDWGATLRDVVAALSR